MYYKTLRDKKHKDYMCVGAEDVIVVVVKKCYGITPRMSDSVWRQ
jgi:hypothetical protein